MAPPRSSTRPKPPLPRFDQQLLAAKNATKEVNVELAIETTYAPECIFTGSVLEVDKYSIKFRIGTKDIWIAKNFIVSVEVLNASI